MNDPGGPARHAGAPEAPLTVAAFPLRGNQYTEALYPCLEATGVRVLDGDFSLRWWLQHRRMVDICHVHWPSFLYYHPQAGAVARWVAFARFVVILLLVRVLGVRIVWTAHNLYPHDGGKTEAVHRLARRLVTRLSHTIFVHGASARQLVEEEFPAARGKTVSVAHGNLIDTYPSTTTREDSRRRLDIAPDRFVYLFFGQCKEYKNLELLADAMRHLDDDSLLVVAGRFRNPAYQQKIEQAMAPLGARVRMVSRHIEDAEVPYFLTAADCLVLPYRDVLTSGVAMLAMSFGRPVVAPRLGALTDVITEPAGVLFEQTSTEAFAAAMLEARRRAFDAHGILQYALSFDWRDNARVTAAALRR